MEKIFKNDTIMGFVAVITLVLVAWIAYENYKSTQLPLEEKKN